MRRRASLNTRRGAVLIVFPAAAMALFALVLFVMDRCAIAYVGARAGALAEASVMTGLRIKAKGLETIGARTNNVGRLADAADASGVDVSWDNWDRFQADAAALQRALPGYAGRIRSAVTAVVAANGVRRDAVQVVEDAGFLLGVTAMPQVVRAPDGAQLTMPGVWCRRTWGEDDPFGMELDSGAHAARLSVPVIGPLGRSVFVRWEAVSVARGRVVWDGDMSDPTLRGVANGGFSRHWVEAIGAAGFEPSRYPVFSTRMEASVEERLQ